MARRVLLDQSPQLLTVATLELWQNDAAVVDASQLITLDCGEQPTIESAMFTDYSVGEETDGSWVVWRHPTCAMALFSRTADNDICLTSVEWRADLPTTERARFLRAIVQRAWGRTNTGIWHKRWVDDHDELAIFLDVGFTVASIETYERS